MVYILIPLFIFGCPSLMTGWHFGICACACKSDIRLNEVGQTDQFKMVGAPCRLWIATCWPNLLALFVKCGPQVSQACRWLSCLGILNQNEAEASDRCLFNVFHTASKNVNLFNNVTSFCSDLMQNTNISIFHTNFREWLILKM